MAGRVVNMQSMTPTSARPMPAARVEDVLLKDGSTLRLRPPRAEDEGRPHLCFEALSPDSRYLRLHGTTLIERDTVARATPGV